MLRRSLLVFLGILLLSLALVVGYALLGLSGPRTVIEAAWSAYQQGQHVEAVRVLDMTEQSAGVRNDAELMRQLRDLRYRALHRTGNYARAIVDIEELSLLVDELDDTTRLDRIELFVRDGRGAEALIAAERFLADHPEDGRALELAGDACQLGYQEDLRKLANSIRRDLSGDEVRAAEAARDLILYLPDGDPAIDEQRAVLRELDDRYVHLRPTWTHLDGRLLKVRKGIQRRLEYYWDALGCDGLPVAVYLGVAEALENSGRDDDLIALSEIYLRRFDHLYAQEAALRIARTHFEAGRMKAVVDVVDRFLPAESWIQRWAANQIDARAFELMLLKGRALLALSEYPKMHLLLRAMNQLWLDTGPPGVEARRVQHFLAAMLLVNQGANLSGALANLLGLADKNGVRRGGLVAIESKTLPPSDGPDLLAIAISEFIRLAPRWEASQAQILDLLNRWSQAEGRTNSPLLFEFRARYFIANGDWNAAYANAQQALALAGEDERLLHLVLEASDGFYGESNLDGVSLLQSCIDQGLSVPDVDHPIQLILVAQAALLHDVHQIALECARRAVNAFNWARWPRLLEARALIALGDHDGAERVLREFLDQHPGSPDALQELLQMRMAANRPLGDLTFDLVRSVEPDQSVSTALLREACRDRSRHLRTIAMRAASLESPSVDLLAQLTTAWALLGDLPAARALAQTIFQPESDAPLDSWTRREVAHAALELLVASAADTNDDELFEQARSVLRHHALPAGVEVATVFDAVLRLHRVDRPRAAYHLLSAITDGELDPLSRNAAHHTLAGRLALRLGDPAAARRHFTAAVSFEDGADAAEPLAVVLVAEGATELAAKTLRAHDISPSNPALAVHLVLAAGRNELADLVPDDLDGQVRGQLIQRLDRDPADLVARMIVTCVDGEAASTPALRSVCEGSRPEVLGLLMLLEQPGFELRALVAAEELSRRYPDNQPVRILLARALGATGSVKDAQTIHDTAAAGETFDPALYGEAVRLARTARAYELNDLLWQRIVVAMKTPDQEAVPVSPQLKVYIAQRLARQLTEAGELERVPDLLTQIWITLPKESGVRLADAVSLFRSGRAGQSLAVLNAMVGTVPDDERGEYWNTLFAVAGTLLDGTDRAQASATRTLAEQVIADEGPFGGAVHYLLADEKRRRGEGARIDDRATEFDARAVELLRGHIDLFASGRDPALGPVLQTIEELASRVGLSEALTVTERLLHRDPAEVRLWLLRAALLERAGDPVKAVAELRRLAGYVDLTDVAVELIRITSVFDELQPRDSEYIQRVAGDQLSSPRFAFVTGLQALRTGRYNEADRMFAAAEPRADGGHLFFRAMANVSRRELNAHDVAARAIRDLTAPVHGSWRRPDRSLLAGSLPYFAYGHSYIRRILAQLPRIARTQELTSLASIGRLRRIDVDWPISWLQYFQAVLVRLPETEELLVDRFAALARKNLAQLAEGYPNSRLARYAGNFLDQLSVPPPP